MGPVKVIYHLKGNNQVDILTTKEKSPTSKKRT